MQYFQLLSNDGSSITGDHLGLSAAILCVGACVAYLIWITKKEKR